MSQRIDQQRLQQIAIITGAPVRPAADRSSGSVAGLYAAFIGLYLVSIAMMASVFLDSTVAVPMVFLAGVVVLAFGLAGHCVIREAGIEALTAKLAQLVTQGIDTLSGRLTAGSTTVRALTLPVLILGGGLTAAALVTFVI